MSKPEPKRKLRIALFGILIFMLVGAVIDTVGTVSELGMSPFDQFPSICYEGSYMPTAQTPNPVQDPPCRCWGYQKMLHDDRPIDGNAAFACYGIRRR